MALKAVRANERSARRRRRARVRAFLAAFGFGALGFLTALGAGVQHGIGCSTCHQMRPFADAHDLGVHAAYDCDRCHAPGGLLTAPAEGIRAVGWGLSAALGKTPGVTTVPDSSCRSCHSSTLSETVVARGIAVRHSDFLVTPCTECHSGTGHRARGRHYRQLEMDDCMGCHKSAATDPKSCERCHVGAGERREGSTAWRATHGPEWEMTHGMGELTSCAGCHEPRVCVECHGVRVPHTADWMATHGDWAQESPGEKCVTCHDSEWCVDCHGVEMPHAPDFLPGHGPLALEIGQDACVRCHDVVSCHVCHFESSHPAVPGVGMGHSVAGP